MWKLDKIVCGYLLGQSIIQTATSCIVESASKLGYRLRPERKPPHKTTENQAPDPKVERIFETRVRFCYKALEKTPLSVLLVSRRKYNKIRKIKNRRYIFVDQQRGSFLLRGRNCTSIAHASHQWFCAPCPYYVLLKEQVIIGSCISYHLLVGGQHGILQAEKYTNPLQLALYIIQ